MEGQVKIFFSFKIQWNMQVYRYMYATFCSFNSLLIEHSSPYHEYLGLIFKSSLLVVPDGNNNRRSAQVDWLIEN